MAITCACRLLIHNISITSSTICVQSAKWLSALYPLYRNREISPMDVHLQYCQMAICCDNISHLRTLVVPVLPSENENAVCQIAIRLLIRLHIESFARRVAENINFLAIFRLLGIEIIAG